MPPTTTANVVTQENKVLELKNQKIKKNNTKPATAGTNHAQDIDFANTLHGKEIKTSLWRNLLSKNSEVYAAASSTYFSMWKDAKQDSKQDADHRAFNYSKLVNSYYNLATDFFEYGWGKSFHFCRFYPGEEFYCAIKRHEHFLALKTGIEPHMKVLDIGCGVGGPARAISHLTGAHITGLNNNAYQVEKAKRYAIEEDLIDRLDFIKGDFMQIPFSDNTFDRAYAIEATCHAPTFEGVYAEIYRILKPGGKFGCYEWCMTDKYDSTDLKHKEISHGIAIGNSLPEVHTIEESLAALRNVGFEIELHVDLANQGDRVHWYYPLEGDLRQCQTIRDILTTLCMTTVGRFTTTNICRVLETIGLAPKGTVQTQKILEIAGDSVVTGGREGIFTPMFFFLAMFLSPHAKNT
ncbi:sterol 24-C-methyltransferase [Backusella circina FSU 941]|nr:sterol 24-C-methyltransferase [Backusella circina FSU 941]